MKLGWTLARCTLSVALSVALGASQCAVSEKTAIERADDANAKRPSAPLMSGDSAWAPPWAERLRGMTVSGSSVGIGNAPSEFFELQQEIIASGASPSAMAQLLESEVPQARAMALVIGARDPATGRAWLLDHACDAGEFDYNPGGCVVTSASVGELARRLLESPGLLGECEACATPLLGREELRRLDWLALSKEDCSNLYDLAASNLLKASFDSTSAHATWQALEGELPGVDAWRRVKAFARLMARADAKVDQQQFRDLLLAIAGSQAVPSIARLAAASALTRAGTEDTVAALERLQPELNALEPGETILHALRGRLMFDEETARLRKSKTWMENEGLAPRVRAAFERFGGEPFALDFILEHGFVSFGSETDAVSLVVERALEAQLERARHPFAEWDIESDLPYRLRQGAVAARRDTTLSALLARAGQP